MTRQVIDSNVDESKEQSKVLHDAFLDGGFSRTGFLALVKFFLWGLLLYFITRLLAIPIAYGQILEMLSSHFGLETIFARPIALAATAIFVALFPTLIMNILFGYKARFILFAMVGGSAAVALATYFFTGDVYFDRSTGEPLKCYAKTLEGFKFSGTCDFDPKLGVRFQKITPDVTREIVFWEKHGKLEHVPDVVPGRYFDTLTGDPIVWYSVRSDGKIRLFPLPGFDPATGEPLSAITKDVVVHYRLDTRQDVLGMEPSGMDSVVLRLSRDYATLHDLRQRRETQTLGLSRSQEKKLQQTEFSINSLSLQLWSWVRARWSTGVAVLSHEDLLKGVRSLGVQVQVERVYQTGNYAILVLSLTNNDRKEDEDSWLIQVLDEDYHGTEIVLIVPDERNTVVLKGLSSFRVHLNSRETKTILLAVKGADSKRLNRGVVQFSRDHFFGPLWEEISYQAL